jgi:hypothetical protein
MLVLGEVFLPLSPQTKVCKVGLPEGAQVLKFGVQVEKGMIQQPGPQSGQTVVNLKPVMLCLLDLQAPVKLRQFIMANVGDPIPDGATYLDGLQLPDGNLVHLLEIPLLSELPQKAPPQLRPVVLSGEG